MMRFDQETLRSEQGIYGIIVSKNVINIGIIERSKIDNKWIFNVNTWEYDIAPLDKEDLLTIVSKLDELNSK